MRELGLTVGPQVFVSETLGYLNVAVEACHHEDLLVELWRLWQGEERSMLEAAGHEVVSGSFRRTAAEHWSFHIDETKRVAVISHNFYDPVPQEHILLHRCATEIQPTMREPYLLARQIGGTWLKDRRLGLVEHLEADARHLDTAGRQLWIRCAFGTCANRAVYSQHPLRPHCPRGGDDLCGALWTDDNLRAAPAVSQVDKKNSFVIPYAVHPAAERNVFSNMQRS